MNLKETYKKAKRYCADGVIYHKEYTENSKARIAIDIIRDKALIAAQDNGEDSSGRARVKRDTPKEIVKFACDVADAAYAEFIKRDWLIEGPTWSEVITEDKKSNPLS